MWYDVLWIVVILAAGIFVAMTLGTIFYDKKRKKDNETELCDLDILVVDNTVDFPAKTIDMIPLKEGETKRQVLFSKAQRIARERLMQAGMKINERTAPLIDERILLHIEEIGAEMEKQGKE